MTPFITILAPVPVPWWRGLASNVGKTITVLFLTVVFRAKNFDGKSICWNHACVSVFPYVGLCTQRLLYVVGLLVYCIWKRQVHHTENSCECCDLQSWQIYKDFHNHYAGYTARLPPGLWIQTIFIHFWLFWHLTFCFSALPRQMGERSCWLFFKTYRFLMVGCATNKWIIVN